MKFLLAYNDQGLDSAFSAPSVEATLPIENLNNPLMTAVARSTGLTLTVSIVIPAGEDYNYIAIVNHKNEFIPLEFLHVSIQNDKRNQKAIYQEAMNIWR